MITRRTDWIRLGALVPLLLLAAVGKQRLTIDVENLAMKSVGTHADQVAALRAEQFGNEPTLVMLAGPIAPDRLNANDDVELARWIDGLESRDEVATLEVSPSHNPGEQFLSVGIKTTDQGRYAAAVASLCAEARATLPPTHRLAISGVPAVEVAIAHALDSEQARILPIIVGVLALVLLAVYRSPVLVLGALLAPLTGVFLLEGLRGLLGLAIDPVSALLGPLVLTVGVASSVHVLERYRLALRSDAPLLDASHRAARELRVPFLLTLVTTVAGFLGLLASPIPAVQRFGILASVGVVLAIGATLLCLPSLLRLLHRPEQDHRRTSARGVLAHCMAVRRWSGQLIGASAVLALVGVGFMGDTHVENDPLKILSPGQRVRKDAQRVARSLGGSEVFELLLPPPSGSRDVAGSVNSLGPFGYVAVLGLAGKVVDLEGVAGPAGPSRTSEDGHILLSFLLAPGGSTEREIIFSESERLARSAGWPEAAATGLSVRLARDSNELILGQREGILATLFGLWLVMSLGFRSAGLGLLGLIPNILPVVLLQGAMAAANHPMSVASSMIATVMLGLVVDDTIHLLHAYRQAPGTALRRLARALLSVRRPVVITTAILCAGFSVTLMGELTPTREFGGLAAATLLIALIADLVLLPALLIIKRPRLFRRGQETPPCTETPNTTS